MSSQRRQPTGSFAISRCFVSAQHGHEVRRPYDTELYRQRHKIENVFGRIKDWRRVATRYDRCAHTFMSAISIAATVGYWL